jgi:hypothetical protein
MMVLVDIGVGPLATMVVASPGKPQRRLRTDIGVIVLIQLMALGYGVKTLWDGRPLYYVFSAGQVDLVSAIAIESADIQEARNRGVSLVPEWNSLPRWVWARVPEDPAEFRRLLIERLLAGGDVITMPQYFHPIAEATEAMRAAYRPVRVVLESSGLTSEEYARRLASLDRPEETLGLLPVSGRRRDGTLVFDRSTGELLTYWPIVLPKQH